MSDLVEYLELASDIAVNAGLAIMEIYQADFSVYEKQDESPLTEADLAAHKIIVSGLNPTQIPVLSEESADISWTERKAWTEYWLVDPLDGTKEFVKRNGEFTVNIALIRDGKPVLGVVYAPALQTLYAGYENVAFKQVGNKQKTEITVANRSANEVCKVVGSRSHQSPEIKAFLDDIPGETELVAMGSSLKLCLVAEGEAHLYPRLGPTSEWDTAAAHAVVKAAGGSVTILTNKQNSDTEFEDSKQDLVYNQKESLLNPYFLVSSTTNA